MEHRRIIKQGPVVLATREDGTMDPSSVAALGLFLADTRFLSRFEIKVNDLEPMLLGSSSEIMYEASYLFTNPALTDIPARALGIVQRSTIHNGVPHITILIVNWSECEVSFQLSVLLESDFYDSFEARGVKRLKRGTMLPPKITETGVDLGYEGLDGITRYNCISVTPHMERFEGNMMYFPITLAEGAQTEITFSMRLNEQGKEGKLRQPLPEIGRTNKPDWFEDHSLLRVDNVEIQSVIERGHNDLAVLLTEFPQGWVPAAGLPRFAVPFGRDSIITSLQTLVWNPHLAHDVLLFLAATQGTKENPWNYEQPGKIMHEMHTGELARLNAIPFGLFYGSVDVTPLYLVLGAEYLRWTGDLDLYRQLKPHFEAAWEWCRKYGQIDGSGYIQYEAHTPPKASSAALTVGLYNQGWKDSSTAVVYSNGEIVKDFPISLAEVQGDYYRAMHLWGEVYTAMPESEGMRAEGERLLQEAENLKAQFNKDFWMPEKNYYAMALDGQHRQVDAIASNPGECLWSRLIADEHADAVADTLLGHSMCIEWGIRTMASTERAYNPFSYHDGSVWPFENALIAAGLKKYGFIPQAQRVFNSLMAASLYFEYRRWPEVYCGVSEQVGGVLAIQPDASSPQAWSAGAIFQFLQTMLGIAPRPFSKRVDITPALPSTVDELVAQNIAIADAHLSVRLVRQGKHILIEILSNEDNLDIIIHPTPERMPPARLPSPAQTP